MLKHCLAGIVYSEIQYSKYCLPAFIAGSPDYKVPKKSESQMPETPLKQNCSSGKIVGIY